VSGLDQQFGDRIVTQNLDATTPDAVAAVAELGFGNHGIVVRSGKGEVLFKQPDHDVDMVEVTRKLGELVAEP